MKDSSSDKILWMRHWLDPQFIQWEMCDWISCKEIIIYLFFWITTFSDCWMMDITWCHTTSVWCSITLFKYFYLPTNSFFGFNFLHKDFASVTKNVISTWELLHKTMYAFSSLDWKRYWQHGRHDINYWRLFYPSNIVRSGAQLIANLERSFLRVGTTNWPVIQWIKSGAASVVSLL